MVGGKDITIRRNKVGRTTLAAAIYIVAEESSKLRNVRNVLVEDNDIINSQNTRPAYNPINTVERTYQAAIEVAGDGARLVNDVLFRRNTVNGAGFDGIRTRGNVCGIGFSMTTMSDVRLKPINLENVNPIGCVAPVACSGNTYRGIDVTNPRCTNIPLPTNVTGSPQI